MRGYTFHGHVFRMYGQTVGIPMGTDCTLRFAYLFLYCYERNCMFFITMAIKLMLSRLTSTSTHLNVVLNILTTLTLKVWSIKLIHPTHFVRFARICNHVTTYHDYQPNVYSKAIGIIHFETHFPGARILWCLGLQILRSL